MMAFSLKKKLPFKKRKQSCSLQEALHLCRIFGWRLLPPDPRNISVHLHQGAKLSTISLLGILSLTIFV